MKINNFFTRAFAALAYVTVIFGSLFLGSLSFGLLCLLLLLLCLNEYLVLLKRLKIKIDVVPPLMMTGLSFILVLAYKEWGLPIHYLALIPLIFVFTMTKELFNRVKSPLNNVAYTAFGMIYTLVPFICLYLLGFYNQYSLGTSFSANILVGLFLLIWANDTGAYLAGSAFGKHKLYERISPKKTIEGSIGGLVLSFVGAYVVSSFATEISMLDWFIVSILVVLFGTIGDLFESLIKRKADVKDSGKVIPGHGGILDRLDSLLFSAPVVLIYLMVIGH